MPARRLYRCSHDATDPDAVRCSASGGREALVVGEVVRGARAGERFAWA